MQANEKQILMAGFLKLSSNSPFSVTKTHRLPYNYSTYYLLPLSYYTNIKRVRHIWAIFFIYWEILIPELSPKELTPVTLC